MKSDHAHLLVVIGATSTIAVAIVLVTALLSISIVYMMRLTFMWIIQLVTFVCEIIVAVIAAITSGTTVTLSIVAAAGAAAVAFPASSIQARVGLSMAVSSAAIVASASAVLCFTTLRIDPEVAFAVVSAAAMSVAFAAAWAVGVMSLIEKETQHVGLKMTSILDTVRRNNFRILKLLLKFQMSSKRRDLDIGLLHAVKAGYKECVQVLLEAGANPDARDPYDNTPLFLACETGLFEISKLLIECGASVGLQHANGRGTALHQAAKWGSVECIQLLLCKSANPNVVDGMWRTPLMLAAMYAHSAEVVLRTLISAGSDVNVFGPEHKTALHFAAARGIDPSALLDAGANVQAVDSTGNTPLHVAAAAGHGPVVRALLASCQSDPNAQNEQRRTPLHLAAIRGSVDCLVAIVEHAGSEACSTQDIGGHLPVWYAAFNGHYDAVVFFIEINCPPFSQQSSRVNSDVPFKLPYNEVIRYSPLQVALEKRHVGVAKALAIGGCESRMIVTDWLLQVHERSETWFKDNADVIDWLDKFAHSPCELSHLCRLKIRQELSTRVRDAVPRLCLPKKLQHFLLMEELMTK